MKQENLKDIREIQINAQLPTEKKIKQYYSQIKSPYCLKYKDTIIHISFSDTENTIKQTLESYFKAIHPPNSILCFFYASFWLFLEKQLKK